MNTLLFVSLLIGFLIIQAVVFSLLFKRFLSSLSVGIDLKAPSFDASSFLSDISRKIDTLESGIKHEVATLDRKFISMDKALAGIPSKTLNTIQGSVNNTAGKLGEMMAFLDIQQSYDRIIISNDIVDFIGIRFPKEEDPGCIHFIDVKTGKSAALSSDQRKLRDMFPEDLDHFAFKVIKTQVT